MICILLSLRNHLNGFTIVFITIVERKIDMISEFSDESTNRGAIIVQRPPGKILVRCYKDAVLDRTIDVSDHSYQYAEDTAENWVLGIIKE